MDRRHTFNVLAGAAVTASLLLVPSAHATGPGQSPDPDPAPEPGTRPCFIVQAQWNDALDGPQPRCPAR